MKKIILSILFALLLVQTSSGITGTSSSYFVQMFGNSVAAGGADSNSYSATFLSENLGTTSNALSTGFMSNIGFFESPYFTTVSIGSYLVSPKSAVIGSTIALSITASSAQSVWVEITAPNSQVQVLNLVNGQVLNYLPVPSVIGRYNLVFYAQSSTGAIASVSDYFDLTEQIISSTSGSGSSGSGSGSSGGIQSCTYNWDCTPWSLCSNGLQTRVCANIGTCIGQENRPIESMSCNQALFDLSIDLEDIQITSGIVRFIVNLQEQFGVEELDVHLKYSIIDSDNFEIFSQIETAAVKESLEIGKEIRFNLEEGDYILRVDVLYGNLQRAFAEQSFTVSDRSGITSLVFVDYINSRRVAFSVILLVISSIMLLAGYYYPIRYNKSISKPSNSVNGLLGLDVYTNNGMKIGKVYDIILHDNVIYGLAVLIDKAAPINHEKVMIKYEYVDNIHDVVVIDSSILEHNPHQST